MLCLERASLHLPIHISVQPRELTNQRDNNNNLLNPYRTKTRLNVFSFPTFSLFRIEYSSISFPVAFSLSPPLQISQGEAFAATTAPAASPSAVQTAAKFPRSLCFSLSRSPSTAREPFTSLQWRLRLPLVRRI
jgi:hypothetical protein